MKKESGKPVCRALPGTGPNGRPAAADKKGEDPMIKRLALMCLALGLMMTAAARADTLALPSGVTEVEAEAFYGDKSLDRVVLPEGTLYICEKAFAYSSVRSIVLPASLKEIASDAFEGVTSLTAYVTKGSAAESFCKSSGITCGPTVTGITLDRSDATLLTGNTVQLTADVLPADAPEKSVSWSSSDAGKARVDENGTVTGVGTGTAVITALARDGSGSCASCSVIVRDGEIGIDPERIVALAPSGSSYDVAVTANGPWTAVSDSSWLHVSTESGSGDGKAVLTAEENLTGLVRSGEVVFTCGAVKVSHTVNQANYTLLVSPAAFDAVSSAGGTLEAAVSSGYGEWTAVSDASWLSVTPSSGNVYGKVVMTIEKSSLTASRSARVVFTSGNVSQTVTVTQSAAAAYTAPEVTALSVSLQGSKYLGISYSVYDCQAFVEKCLSDAGLVIDLAGSNAWYRAMTWVGTPEECTAEFGYIPKGAFLFIWADDGGEPSYYTDGLGNASHIGIYTGTGKGAVNASYSRYCVAESYFACSTINGGWNTVGLWNRLDYGDDKINSYLAGR